MCGCVYVRVCLCARNAWDHRFTEIGDLSAIIPDIKSLRAGDNRWRIQLLPHPPAKQKKKVAGQKNCVGCLTMNNGIFFVHYMWDTA